MGSLFDTCVAEIELAYSDLGHSLGWRFLNTTRRVLDEKPEIALITLNPGGSTIPPDHPWASCENGPSYLFESWGSSPPGESKLQIQFRTMFEQIAALIPAADSGSQLIERSLIGYFIPFRSPSIADLPNREASIAFGRSLWTKILTRVEPKLIICIDRKSASQIHTLFRCAIGKRLSSKTSFDTGWGHYKADVSRFEGGQTLLRLPHLSRFSLFASEKCESNLRDILSFACSDL